MHESFWNEVIDCIPYAMGRVRNSLDAPMNICEDVVSDAILGTALFVVSEKFERKCQTSTLFYRVVSRRMIDFIRTKKKLEARRVGVIVNFDCFYIDDFVGRFEAKELERLCIAKGKKPCKRKARVREWEENNYDESEPKVRLSWWKYLSYHFKPF